MINTLKKPDRDRRRRTTATGAAFVPAHIRKQLANSLRANNRKRIAPVPAPSAKVRPGGSLRALEVWTELRGDRAAMKNNIAAQLFGRC